MSDCLESLESTSLNGIANPLAYCHPTPRQQWRISFSCTYLIVWCTKYRRKVLENGVDERLKKLITENAPGRIIKLEILPDRVVLILGDVHPRNGIHQVIKKIKRETSHKLREDFCWLKTILPTLWTNSYLLMMLGDIPEQFILRFIEEQKYV